MNFPSSLHKIRIGDFYAPVNKSNISCVRNSQRVYLIYKVVTLISREINWNCRCSHKSQGDAEVTAESSQEYTGATQNWWSSFEKFALIFFLQLLKISQNKKPVDKTVRRNWVFGFETNFLCLSYAVRFINNNTDRSYYNLIKDGAWTAINGAI